MTHPYLTFTLILFALMLMNNLVVGIVKSNSDSEIDKSDEKNNFNLKD